MIKRNIVVLTGAGISRESGLPTFRDADGLWSSQRLLDLARPGAFLHDPVAVHDFYNARRAQARSPEVQPNPAHLALARLEQMWGGDVVVVTQNVDDLHERAGSSKVLHMHGRLNQIRCNACSTRHTWTGDVFVDTPCPACGAARLRPDIVWFGEMPFHMEEIDAVLGRCERWPGKFGQVDKWKICLRAARVLHIRSENGETSTSDAQSGFQGKGRTGCHQGREDAG